MSAELIQRNFNSNSIRAKTALIAGAIALLFGSGCSARFFRVPTLLSSSSYIAPYAPGVFGGSTFVDLNLQSSAIPVSTPGDRKISSVNISESIPTGAIISDGMNRQISGGIYYGY